MAKRKAPEAELGRLRQTLLNHVCAPDYQPSKATKLLRAAHIPEGERQAARQVIAELINTGVLVLLKRKGLALAESADLFTGKISFVRSGAAYVNSLDGTSEVYVRAADSGTALPGDKVLVRLNPRPSRGKAKREGTVIRVLERCCRTIVGTLRHARRMYYVQPMQSQIAHDIIVPGPGQGKPGDRVLVRVAAWDDPRLSPEGDIIEVIGPADDPALDTLAVMKAYELPEAFPDAVMHEAEKAAVKDADFEGRLDLRDQFVFTIDPKTARDFDDAISFEPAADGHLKLGVHIADVGHFVQPGSELDNEACRRGTSVYLPDRVIPMLPVQLSNGICSLSPEAERLAFSVFMTLTADGELLDQSFHETVIRSRRRLTYYQALAALQSPQDAQFPDWRLDKQTVARLKEIGSLAQRLRARRFAAGALQMDLPELKFEIGRDGRIAAIKPEPSDAAHQLIEEFMLLANECVCRELAKREVAQIYRIHEEPDPVKLAELTEMFMRAGISPGDLSDRRQMSALLESIAEMPQAHAWNTAVLRALKRAKYSIEGIGHYGLAKTHYTHFTSPIRRYPDLVIHRLLKAALAGNPPPYAKPALAELAPHCSEREEIAAKAEREVIDLKKLRFFAEQLESGDLHEYEAVVTEVRNFGMMIDVPAVQTFGLIHVSQLSQDFFDFIAGRQELCGRRSHVVYRVGSRLKVIIVRVDSEKRQFDFAPAKWN